MFLAGYPNDGCAIVDEEKRTARVYDTIYYVNAVTNTYTEFSSSNLLEVLEKPDQNENLVFSPGAVRIA